MWASRPFVPLVAMPTCLLWSECQSVTVSLTDFPVTRAFIHSDGRYLFRVKALWQAYAAKGLTTTYCHWMKHWFQSLEEAGVPPSELIKPSTKHGFVNAYAMSVAALIGLMFRILQAKGRRPETVLETLRVLTALDGFCRQCVETTIAQDVLIADVPVPLIYLRGQGLANCEKVVGLLEDRDFASSAWAAHSGVSQAHSGEARARISLRSAFSCPSLLDACFLAPACWRGSGGSSYRSFRPRSKSSPHWCANSSASCTRSLTTWAPCPEVRLGIGSGTRMALLREGQTVPGNLEPYRENERTGPRCRARHVRRHDGALDAQVPRHVRSET